MNRAPIIAATDSININNSKSTESPHHHHHLHHHRGNKASTSSSISATGSVVVADYSMNRRGGGEGAGGGGSGDGGVGNNNNSQTSSTTNQRHKAAAGRGRPDSYQQQQHNVDDNDDGMIGNNDPSGVIPTTLRNAPSLIPTTLRNLTSNTGGASAGNSRGSSTNSSKGLLLQHQQQQQQMLLAAQQQKQRKQQLQDSQQLLMGAGGIGNNSYLGGSDFGDMMDEQQFLMGRTGAGMMLKQSAMGDRMGMMMMNDPMMMNGSIRGSGGNNSSVNRSNMMRNSMMMQTGGGGSSVSGLSGMSGYNDMTGNGGFDSSSIVPSAMGQTRMSSSSSLGYPHGSTGSPGLGASTAGLGGDSIRGTFGALNNSQPLTAEEQAIADQEEELLLGLLLARRQRNRHMDGKNSTSMMRNQTPQQSLADEMFLLKQQQRNRLSNSMGMNSMGDGDLGMSSQGSSLRMPRTNSSGALSTSLSGSMGFYNDGLDYLGSSMSNNYMDLQLPSMSRQASMMGNKASRLSFSDPLGQSQIGGINSSNYRLAQQQQQMALQGMGNNTGSGLDARRQATRLGIDNSAMSDNQFHTLSNRQQLALRQSDVSERIARSPGRLLIDARSAGTNTNQSQLNNQNQMVSDNLMGMTGEFMERGVKRNFDGMSNLPVTYNQPNIVDIQRGSNEVVISKQLQKTKRTHKKKPSDMPRRPLSAYNLFFSKERERILKELKVDGKDNEGNDTADKEIVDKEDDDGDDAAIVDSIGSEAKIKPNALLRPLIPCEKKRRPHRKTHGQISFQQLARMVGERWKNLPEPQRKYYQDLADEDMRSQKAAMEEYYSKQNNASSTMVSKSVTKGNDMDKLDEDQRKNDSKQQLKQKEEKLSKDSKKLTTEHKKKKTTSNVPFASAATASAVTDIAV